MTMVATTAPLLKYLPAFMYLDPEATWRSGYAAVCKTVYPGSIPGVASNNKIKHLDQFLVLRFGFEFRSGNLLGTLPARATRWPPHARPTTSSARTHRRGVPHW
jgi:hypothetical protein